LLQSTPKPPEASAPSRRAAADEDLKERGDLSKADQHELGLSGTFAEACRAADREYRQQKALAREEAVLPRSTADAIDYLLKQNDAERLRNFLVGGQKPSLSASNATSYGKHSNEYYG
jgi:hypothetical protein